MCLLHRAKSIFFNVMLFNNEVKNLPRMFLKNSYPHHFFDLTLKKFKNMAEQKRRTNDDKKFCPELAFSVLEIRHINLAVI